MAPEEYFLEYNKDNIFKNLIQCEDHLKNLSEPGFNQCALKHLLFTEGELEEAVTHSLIVAPEKHDNYKALVSKVRNIRKEVQKGRADPKKTSMQVRNLRRDFEKFNRDFNTAECKACGDSIKSATKHLNTKATFNNHTHNSNHISDYNQLNGENEDMAKTTYSALMYMNAGQFAAEGVRYLVETQKPEWDKYVSIGGGIGLQALSLFVKMPSALKNISMIAGSNLLANGVVKMVKGVTPAVGMRAVSMNGTPMVGNATAGKFTGRPNGRVFGGPVTATNIPTQYARSGVLSGAQAFEDPMHAGMIRVD